MLYRNGFEPKSPLKWDVSQPSKMFIDWINHGSIRFQDIGLFILLNSCFVLLILWLLDLVQKCFYTPDRARSPTFQMRYVPSSIIVARDIIQTFLRAFFGGHPVSKNGENSGPLTSLPVNSLNGEWLQCWCSCQFSLTVQMPIKVEPTQQNTTVSCGTENFWGTVYQIRVGGKLHLYQTMPGRVKKKWKFPL